MSLGGERSRLTRQHLAGLVGVRPETVSRLIAPTRLGRGRAACRPWTGEPGASARSTFFRGLSESEIEELRALQETRDFRSGEPIVGPETPPEQVYLVKAGTVRLFHRGPHGREIAALVEL